MKWNYGGSDPSIIMAQWFQISIPPRIHYVAWWSGIVVDLWWKWFNNSHGSMYLVKVQWFWWSPVHSFQFRWKCEWKGDMFYNSALVFYWCHLLYAPHFWKMWMKSPSVMEKGLFYNMHLLFIDAIYYMHLTTRKYGWNPPASSSYKVPWKERR
jgi:hypothetical protein